MATLLKAITNSDTVIWFTGEINFPQDDGVIQIDSEFIVYTTIYQGTMYGCVRGARSTTPASHTTNSLITLVDFFSPVDAVIETLAVTTLTSSGTLTQAQTYSGTSSNQGIASDETLTIEAGRDKGEGGSFQAAIMGNVHATSLAETGNYVAGLIGAYSVTSTNASELPSGAVIGDIQDPSNSANGIFTAVIDGNDPSGVTRAGAAFKARQLNNNAGSGVDFGLDLFDTAVSGYLSSPTLPLAIAKADIRMTNEVCVLNGAGVPTNGVTGANFAQKGSVYSDRTNGVLYINTGTKTSPVWNTVSGSSATPNISFARMVSPFSTANSSYDDTGLSVTLTPSSNTATIEIQSSGGMYTTGATATTAQLAIYRDGSLIVAGDYIQFTDTGTTGVVILPYSFTIIDVPGNTSLHTYTLMMSSSDGATTVGLANSTTRPILVAKEIH